MQFGNIELSRGFFLTVVVIVFLYFLLPSIFSKSAIENHETYVEEVDRSYDEHQENILQELAQYKFYDPKLRACIFAAVRERAAVPPSSSGSINSPADITMLQCGNWDIESLDGIRQMTGLSYIDLSYNKIRSVAPLANHPSLQRLDIRHNPLVNVDGLSSIINLSEVKLPKLPNMSCKRLRLQLKRVRANISATGCKKPDAKEVAARKLRGDTLRDDQERELFEFEMDRE